MGLISLLFSDPLVFAIVAVVLVAAITIHEFAHAWMADYLGDPTPRSQDRVTLDPRAHLDPIGTVMLLFIGFGWGKPVMFDPYNLKDPKKDAALIALAGPASNLILALLMAILLPIIATLVPAIAGITLHVLGLLLFFNVMLALFNLVPVYPLDGSKILLALLPEDFSYEYQKVMQQYGQLILIALLIPWNGASPISQLISPPMQFLVSLYQLLAATVLSLI